MRVESHIIHSTSYFNQTHDDSRESRAVNVQKREREKWQFVCTDVIQFAGDQVCRRGGGWRTLRETRGIGEIRSLI